MGDLLDSLEDLLKLPTGDFPMSSISIGSGDLLEDSFEDSFED